MILLISASQVARITSMSHQCPVDLDIFRISSSSDEDPPIHTSLVAGMPGMLLLVEMGSC
jgi:hypothetical protein